MARRVPWRLIAILGAALLLAGVVLGIVRACTAPRSLTTAQFEALVASGRLAQISNEVADGPGRPEIDLQQEQASYRGVPTCTQYWTAASQHLIDSASLRPTNPGESEVQQIDVELWDDPGTAAASVTDWATCLGDFQEVSRSASYPLKVKARGSQGEVSWQYSQNVSADQPVRLLALRSRNVVATFQLPDGPDAEWRDKLVAAFASDVAAASKR